MQRFLAGSQTFRSAKTQLGKGNYSINVLMSRKNYLTMLSGGANNGIVSCSFLSKHTALFGTCFPPRVSASALL